MSDRAKPRIGMGCDFGAPGKAWIADRGLGTWRLLVLLVVAVPLPGYSQPFQLPTANRALLQAGAEEKAFAGTTGHPWPSGTFGCVRNSGSKFHEGLDIRSVQHDKRGEPTDPVLASADGVVAYLNARPSLSNYGNYLVLRHYVEGLEIYTLYGHLSEIRPGLRIGDRVKAGDRVGTMGRTANTREGISKDRAHVHFEINLVLNDRYIAWHARYMAGTRNDHGNFNGRNLIGMDPWAVFKEQQRLGAQFSLVKFIQSQPELCRVLVRKTDFPLVRRYRPLLESNARADKEGIAGYELALGFNGLPVRLIPRAASEMNGAAEVRVSLVNRARATSNPCGHLVAFKGSQWVLLPSGANLISLITFR